MRATQMQQQQLAGVVVGRGPGLAGRGGGNRAQGRRRDPLRELREAGARCRTAAQRSEHDVGPSSLAGCSCTVVIVVRILH